MTVRRRLVVHGWVQGVGFRVSVARVAESRGVSGWARNLPDGSVEVVLEGDRTAVEAVERFCREGPRHAEVARVDATDEEPERLGGFAVY